MSIKDDIELLEGVLADRPIGDMQALAAWVIEWREFTATPERIRRLLGSHAKAVAALRAYAADQEERGLRPISEVAAFLKDQS